MCEQQYPPDLTGVPDIREAETLWNHCLYKCMAQAKKEGREKVEFKDVDALVLKYANRLIRWELYEPGTEPEPKLTSPTTDQLPEQL